MTVARLIIDPPASGSWNMAVDEALLRSADQTGRLTLRLYQWDQPTLSLGYFQDCTARHAHSASHACPLVRRATGGGAIVHDREITYSLTAPIRHRLDHLLGQWYQLIHGTWLDTLSAQGVAAELCPQTDPQLESRFLCFERRSAGDLLLNRAKIGGSAQRRHRRAALQHGSLLLDRSSAAPELPGLAQLSGPTLSISQWQAEWVQQLAQRLEVRWEPGGLSIPERTMAGELQRSKFGHAEWTLRR